MAEEGLKVELDKRVDLGLVPMDLNWVGRPVASPEGTALAPDSPEDFSDAVRVGPSREVCHKQVHEEEDQDGQEQYAHKQSKQTGQPNLDSPVANRAGFT